MSSEMPKLGKEGKPLPQCVDSDFAKQNTDLMNSIVVDGTTGKLAVAKPRNVKTVNDLIQ